MPLYTFAYNLDINLPIAPCMSLWVWNVYVVWACNYPTFPASEECNTRSSGIKWVWIQSFPFLRLVALQRLKNLVCITIYPSLEESGEQKRWLSKGHKSEVKCISFHAGFELKMPYPFLKIITITLHASIYIYIYIYIYIWVYEGTLYLPTSLHKQGTT